MEWTYQSVVDAVVPVLSAVAGYYYRKIHQTETAVRVLRAEVERDRSATVRQHEETIQMLKEMREESREGLREVRASISQLMNREGK